MITLKDGNLRPLIPFAIGGASSATAGFIVYPINLIKTKMQAMRPKDFEELGIYPLPKDLKPSCL